MNYWVKINNWEKKLEKGPKTKLIRFTVLVFSFSIVFGAFFSFVFTSFQARAIGKIENDIRQTEILRMNLLIKSIEKNTYK